MIRQRDEVIGEAMGQIGASYGAALVIAYEQGVANGGEMALASRELITMDLHYQMTEKIHSELQTITKQHAQQRVYMEQDSVARRDMHDRLAKLQERNDWQSKQLTLVSNKLTEAQAVNTSQDKTISELRRYGQQKESEVAQHESHAEWQTGEINRLAGLLADAHRKLEKTRQAILENVAILEQIEEQRNRMIPMRFF